MAPQKAPPTQPVLETYHNVKQATVRLGLATEDPEDTRGQRWLRDGANRPADGSKGAPFPHRRMANQLMFSDSDLAWIAENCMNAPDRRGRSHNRSGTRRKPPTKKPAA